MRWGGVQREVGKKREELVPLRGERKEGGSILAASPFVPNNCADDGGSIEMNLLVILEGSGSIEKQSIEERKRTKIRRSRTSRRTS
jgi:hypothetical protein